VKHFAFFTLLQIALFVQPVCVFAQLGGGGNAGNANKKITDIRKERLETHFAAFVTWVDHYCELTEKQKTEFNRIIVDLIEKGPHSIAEVPGVIYSRQYLNNLAPVRFVDTHGAAGVIYHAGLEESLLKILTDQQKEKWQTAINKRKQALHEIFLERVINTAEKKLTLTDKQKQQLKKIFPDHLSLLENGLYSFEPRNQYVNEKSILIILTQPPMAYRKEQWELLKPVRNRRLLEGRRIRTKNIRLMAIDGPEGWRKTINTEAEQFQDELQKLLQKKSQEKFLGNKLSPEQLRYLEVARKGAAFRTVKEWKRKSLLATVQYEKIIEQRPGINFGFSVPGIESSKIDQHPLWENTVAKVKASLLGEAQSNYSEFTINYAVAMLDQELWFTDEQLPKIRKLYRSSHLANELLYSGEQYELYLLATIIDAKKESELESILSQQQLTAFQTLKNQYEIEDSFLRFFKRDR